MRQAFEIKQETRQIKTIVTVMLYGSSGSFSGHESFCGLEIVGADCVRAVSFDANAFSFLPLLSRKLTGKPASSASRSRLRRVSLLLSKPVSAEAHSALSASCVLPEVSSARQHPSPPRRPRVKQNRHSIASRPRDGFVSISRTQPGATSGLGFHNLKNVAARLSVVCCPETECCGTSAGFQI